MDNTAIEIASTLQTASIKRHPSPAHDVNPGTAASEKFPLLNSDAMQAQLQEQDQNPPMSLPPSPSAIPPSLLPRPRRPAFPPLPDMRFEQSYLASIPPHASPLLITWITIRDHILMPLGTGAAWTLLFAGWRHWNRGANMAGENIGARIRRWWWRVNNWDIPTTGKRMKKSGT